MLKNYLIFFSGFVLAHPEITGDHQPEYILSPEGNLTLTCKSDTPITWTHPVSIFFFDFEKVNLITEKSKAGKISRIIIMKISLLHNTKIN